MRLEHRHEREVEREREHDRERPDDRYVSPFWRRVIEPCHATWALRAKKSMATVTTMRSGKRYSEIAAPSPREPELIPICEGPGREHLRRVERPSRGEDVDDGEVSRGEHDAEEHRDERDRELQREVDVPQLLEAGRAVDLGRVLDLVRDRGTAGDEDHDRERKDPPRVHERDRDQREVRPAEPLERHLRALLEVRDVEQPEQRVVEMELGERPVRRRCRASPGARAR